MNVTRIVGTVLSIPRAYKRLLAMSVDVSLCIGTVWLAYCLRLDGWVGLTGEDWLPVTVSLLLAIPIFIMFGLYRAIFRYAGVAAFMAILRAVSIYWLAFMSAFTIVGVPGVPRSIGIMQPLLLLVGIALSRLTARHLLSSEYKSRLKHNARLQVVIYGAGTAGRQIASALDNSPKMRVIGFLDDDPRLHGSIMRGLPIWPPDDLAALVRSRDVKEVLLAIPSASRQRRNAILESVRHLRVVVRTLPGLDDIAQGRVEVGDIKELEIEDILGRNTIAPRLDLMEKNIRGKTVMVTGAGGSIGSELCRQIVRYKPECLVLVDQGEFGLYAVHRDLEDMGVRIVPLLSSVRDEARIREIIATFRPDTLYHAAAYKHVPLVEHNPAEGFSNNVMGTMITAKAAQDFSVADFVLISTDKAVRPTNVMGASKRLAEMVLQALAAEQDQKKATKFCMVRFGNVLGSSGSVVPLFRQQIRDGGPITLTHPDVTRYFMTIPEASQLVIQAGAMSNGGDVFVLDMGEPVLIQDLARRMIELSGLQVRDETNPDGDIEIAITGLRPGEKLYEELLIADNPLPTEHPRILKAHEYFLPWTELEAKLQRLQVLFDSYDADAARLLLKQLVSGYQPDDGLHDLVAVESSGVRTAAQ